MKLKLSIFNLFPFILLFVFYFVFPTYLGCILVPQNFYLRIIISIISLVLFSIICIILLIKATKKDDSKGVGFAGLSLFIFLSLFSIVNEFHDYEQRIVNSQNSLNSFFYDISKNIIEEQNIQVKAILYEEEFSWKNFNFFQKQKRYLSNGYRLEISLDGEKFIYRDFTVEPQEMINYLTRFSDDPKPEWNGGQLILPSEAVLKKLR